MSSRTPSLAEVLRRHQQAGLSGVHTALPGRVERYDAATQRAHVKPLLRRGYADEEGVRQTESLPVITDVPVVFPGAGDFSVIFPIAKGDTVLLVFAEGSLDRWLTKGGEVDPQDDRRFSLTDAIAIPGLRHGPIGGSAEHKIEFTSSEIKAGGNQQLATKADLDALKSAISGAATTPNDGGAAFKAAILAALSSWPTGTQVLKGS